MPTTIVRRRAFMAACSSLGLSSTLFPGVLWGMIQQPPPSSGTPPSSGAPTTTTAPAAAPQASAAAAAPALTKEMVRAAVAVAGLSFDEAQLDLMVRDLNDRLGQYKAIWDLKIPNDVAPALVFDPVLPGMTFEHQKRPLRLSRIAAPEVLRNAPQNIEDVAFYTVRQLGELLRTKKISSTALTEMYLERLKRYDPVLHFVVTLTPDRATAQASEADAAIAHGKYRGPLHGIPWGAKDLLKVGGYRTTWGAAGFEEQKFEGDATVVKRLDEAGAVLVGKLTLGALAQGDVWFGGRTNNAVTRNPWKPEQGSSGSSAGSASATAAGCIGFGIGSETLGSIASPSTRNGATGLRPSFGLVPRTGAMALSWSMDKLGPLCRSVEDCAVVLNAIYGPDGSDRSVHDVAFNYDAETPLKSLRVGYLKSDFEAEPSKEQLARETPEQKALRLEAHKFDEAALDVLRSKLGINLIAVEMPKMPVAAMRPILVAEAAAAFDELTRSGRDKLLTAQARGDWPNTFRQARLIPAVEYINANRARAMLMEQTAEVFKKFDVLVASTFAGSQLLITNLTGNPAVIMPNGFRAGDGTPVSITFLGQLYGEGKLLVLARAYQEATGFHLQHPKLRTEATPNFLPAPPPPATPPARPS